MALGLTPKALSLSKPIHRYGTWVPAFAGMSGLEGRLLGGNAHGVRRP